MDNEQVDILMERLNSEPWSKAELVATIGVLVKHTNGITLKNFNGLLKDIKKVSIDIDSENGRK